MFGLRRRPPVLSLRVLGFVVVTTTGVAAPSVPTPSAPTAPATARKPPAALGFEASAKLAAEAREAGRLEAAIGHYERALKQRPDWIEGRWALATLHYDRNQYALARTHFALVAKERPTDGLALAMLGLCEASLNEDERAAADLRRAIDLGIGSPEVKSAATYQAAILTNKLGDPDGAFELLRVFGREEDDRPSVIAAFGLTLLRLPLTPAEIPAEKRELILLAGRAGYHMARARRSTVGYLAIEEMVSRFPAEPNVHYAQGMYLLPDDPAAAIEAFRRELTVSPNHYVAMIHIALAELKRGRAEAALPMAEQAVSLAPNVPAARMALGQSFLDLGQIERAIEAMQTAVKLAPEVPRLRYSLAQVYARAGRREDAARERAEFQRLQGTSGEATEGGVPSAPDGDNSTD